MTNKTITTEKLSGTDLYQALIDKKVKIAVIGLGYVGLPIALEFAKQLSVIGFDINKQRIAMMQEGIDPSRELVATDFENKDILFTHNVDDLQEARFYIVAVPTPINEHKIPNLKALISASTNIGSVLKQGDYVVFESTVYPGCTEEDCIPVLEKLSGLKAVTDFKIGYSPERINPGDKEHTISKITKVVSGCDAESLEVIAKVYELIVEAGVYRASSIKVAEAAKVIENTQRDLNIALMNELSIIFDKMNINTPDVLAAAGTKWNFLRFFPGLVGGHCIGVDPYYLTYKSIQLGYKPQIILSGRRINDEMAAYVAKKTVQQLIQLGKNIGQTKVLVMGATFKENVSDIRNSKVAQLVEELQSFFINVDLVDPHASTKEVEHEYGLQLCPEIGKDYDGIILAVKHEEYLQLDEPYFKSILKPDGIFIDIKGVFNHQIKDIPYWTL